MSVARVCVCVCVREREREREKEREREEALPFSLWWSLFRMYVFRK